MSPSPRQAAQRALIRDAHLASLLDLGTLKRTERPRDWDDIELIVSRLRNEGDSDGVMLHLFGNALVSEMESSGNGSFVAAE